MMKYKKSICPINKGARVTITLEFDRQINFEKRYASWIGQVHGGVFLDGDFTPFEIDFLTAIERTPEVLRGPDSGGRVTLQGNVVTVDVIAIGRHTVREIANQIVKKVQRRIAKGERRQCLK